MRLFSPSKAALLIRWVKKVRILPKCFLKLRATILDGAQARADRPIAPRVEELLPFLDRLAGPEVAEHLLDRPRRDWS